MSLDCNLSVPECADEPHAGGTWQSRGYSTRTYAYTHTHTSPCAQARILRAREKKGMRGEVGCGKRKTHRGFFFVSHTWSHIGIKHTECNYPTYTMLHLCIHDLYTCAIKPAQPPAPIRIKTGMSESFSTLQWSCERMQKGKFVGIMRCSKHKTCVLVFVCLLIWLFVSLLFIVCILVASGSKYGERYSHTNHTQ